MKTLIIADLHLKPKMFDQAHKLLEAGLADMAVSLGDLVDDWGEEFNIGLYGRTMQRALEFHKDHPNTLWAIGNHDVGYYAPELGVRETGHSKFQEGEMGTWIREFKKRGVHQKVFHKVDNVLFSHAGLNKNWMERHKKPGQTLDEFIEYVNAGPEGGFKYIYLWEEDSPIWWRPQTVYEGDPSEAYDDGILQVVGHSPMRHPLKEGNILSCDVFSTNHVGIPFGNQAWVVVDTDTKAWIEIDYEEGQKVKSEV